ncbi:MAG TPA: BON domain-containing protein [Candidatus Angelobacter sp.]|nr:BON domain-containing protein [Candidatus Angelobacter sp.]
MKTFHLLVFVLALSLAYATAQTGSPASSSPSGQDQTSPQSTQGAQSGSTSDVQTQIQSAFKNDPTLSNNSINVAVTDDAVELTGTVASAKDKQTAHRIAQSYAGSRKVKDHITVASDKPSTDTNPDQTKQPPPPNSH